MRFSNLGISRKLYLGFGAVVLILAVLLATAYTNFSRLAQANGWNNHTHEVIAETSSLLENLLNMETGERGYALTGDQASLAPLKAGQAGFGAHLTQARKLTADNAGQQGRLQQLEQAQLDWYGKAVEPALALRRKANDSAGIDPLLAFERDGHGRQGMDRMRALLADIGGAEEKLLAQRATEAEALRVVTGNTLLYGGLLTMALAMALAWLLSSSIVRPLAQAVQIARTVAAGDLSSEVPAGSEDETGQLLRALGDMSRSLVKIVGEVRRGTDTIASASTEIASGNQDLSARTEQQASSLEETASSMEQLTGTVRQNADNARQANVLAASASDVAQRGGDVVEQVIDTMNAISNASKSIVDIIAVIDGIAFQTNILALNAAVEAARAGEQGRGFAVVATEVRNLAQRSAAAAREIKQLIGNSVEQVDAGSKLVHQAGGTMREVVDSVRRVTDIMQEIASASAEQIAGIEQINQAISQMDTTTQQNAALVEQAAAAAEALQEQAASQAQVVSVFRLAAGQLAPAQPAPARMAAPRATAAAAPARPPATPARLAPPRPASKPARTPAAGNDDWEEF